MTACRHSSRSRDPIHSHDSVLSPYVYIGATQEQDCNMSDEKKSNKRKFWFVVTLSLLVGMLSGGILMMHTADRWYVPPVDYEKLALHNFREKACRPLQFRVIECGLRADGCICQEIPPEILNNLKEVEASQ